MIEPLVVLSATPAEAVEIGRRKRQSVIWPSRLEDIENMPTPALYICPSFESHPRWRELAAYVRAVSLAQEHKVPVQNWARHIRSVAALLGRQ